MKQALLGLQHMHSQNLVHRDIKPENLLLSNKENDANVKVADFGFSKPIKTDHDLYETLGTPPYMAPEIVILRNDDLQNPVGYGRPVDVWALGICLYILLSGIHPYQIEDEDKMLDNIEDGIWPGWKGNNWSNVSQSAKNLIEGMMNPDANKRFTLKQCLESPWITDLQPDTELDPEALKAYQAKKKLKGAIRGVMATNKLAGILALGAAKKPGTNPVAPALKEVAAPVAKKTPTWTTLKVIVHSGRNLAPKDTNGKSDPYCLVWCGAAKALKTKTQKATLNPKWEDANVFEVSAAQAQGKNLEVEVWDWDFVPPDEFMGKIVLPVDGIPAGEVVKNFYKLERTDQPKHKKATVSGELLLEIQKI